MGQPWHINGLFCSSGKALNKKNHKTNAATCKHEKWAAQDVDNFKTIHFTRASEQYSSVVIAFCLASLKHGC